jgi:GNAT superfamily N-acetyltransferase
MLVTHPDYRRQGAGSTLIQWGCDRADEEGVHVYVDAHQAAAPLYRKFGFRERTDVEVDLQGALPMVRESQLKN